MNITGILLLLLALVTAIGLVLLKPFAHAGKAGLVLLCLVTFAILLLGWRETRLANGFDRVKNTSTQKDIRKLVGKPHEITRCDQHLLYNETPTPRKNCQSIWWYHSFFFPSVWQYNFDPSGHLTRKVRFVSP